MKQGKGSSDTCSTSRITPWHTSPMRPLRILHIITRLEQGGAPMTVLDILNRLDKTQYACYLATGLADPPEMDMIPAAKAMGVPIFVVPELVRDVHLWKDVAALFKLIGLIKAGRYDVVHTHTYKAGFIGRLAARFCGVKSILYSPHGTILEGYFGKAKITLFAALDRLAARYTDKIICLTQREIEQYLDAGIGHRDQYDFVYNGIDLSPFAHTLAHRDPMRKALGLSRDNWVCVIVGRLVPVKGHRFLVEALAKARNLVPNLKLLCIGDGPLETELRRQAMDLGIREHIRFLGFRTDIPEVLSACDLFVLASLNEGFGLVLLEAMAAGLPAIATHVGGVPEVVEDGATGLLVPPEDAQAMAKAMVDLLRSPEQMAQMSANALACVQERFSIKATMAKLERIYMDALG